MKRGIQKQLSLPFDADFVEKIFAEFEPEIEKWHKFQDQPKATCGNCFYWWKSRYGDWIQEKRPQWSVSEYIETDKLFRAFGKGLKPDLRVASR